MISSTNPCILYIVRRFRRRFQFVNLINHNTIQWYSRWKTSNPVLSEEKRTKNWSILMSSQDTTLLLYSVMSSCEDPVSTHSISFTFFAIKVNEVHTKSNKIIKRLWKFENIVCRLRKAELDLELLVKCRDNKVIPKFSNFRLVNRSLRFSLTYAHCQSNLLLEEKD